MDSGQPRSTFRTPPVARGDTLWANMQLAYDELSGPMKACVDQSHLSRIEGLPNDESRSLLDFLATRSNDVSIPCRFYWKKDAVAIWDERATQHSGTADHRGSARMLRRRTIEGERPA